MIKCPICNNINNKFVFNIEFSNWLSFNRKHLKRKNYILPIVKCITCTHVYINKKYDKKFINFLYKGGSKSDTIPSIPEIYIDIINTSAKFVNISKSHIVDVGCGNMKLLENIKNLYKIDDNKLVGFDFINKSEKNYYRLDLNNPKEYDNINFVNNLKKSNIVFLVHVIEHLIDPKNVINFINANIDDNAILYIEVPDIEYINNIKIDPNLIISAHHIHYFSTFSLKLLLGLCGFTVIEEQKIISDKVPRLKVVAKKNINLNDEISLSHFKNNIEAKVKYNLEITSNFIKQNKKIIIYGLGNEGTQLISKICELFDFEIINKNLIIIDENISYLKNNAHFMNIKIHHPNILKNLKEKLYILISPFEFTVRDNIEKKIATFDVNYEILK